MGSLPFKKMKESVYLSELHSAKLTPFSSTYSYQFTCFKTKLFLYIKSKN